MSGRGRCFGRCSTRIAESRADKRLDWERVLHTQPTGSARPKIQLRDAATTVQSGLENRRQASVRQCLTWTIALKN
jgi:hypothetical protein